MKEMKIAFQHCYVLYIGRRDVDKEEAMKQFISEIKSAKLCKDK